MLFKGMNVKPGNKADEYLCACKLNPYLPACAGCGRSCGYWPVWTNESSAGNL